MGSDRREFLQRAGGALAGIAVSPRLLPGAHVVVPAPSEDANKGAAREPIRGLMVDAARLPESLDYYRRVIEFCADWGLNTLQFRLTDDQGSALRFTSVPDLITHPDAFTADQLKGLVEFARGRGVDVIPEIECFGHTGFITRSPRYAHLLDNDEHGSAEFTGVIPVLPETLELFERLYREIAETFSSVFVHAGCDEVNWGGSAQSRKALQAKTRAQIWAEYLNSLNKMVAGLGKQMIVWGDFVLHKEPEILTGLDKNIIIMDWNYWETSAVEIYRAIMTVKSHGFRALGAPALISYRWGPRAGRQQFRNIDAFAESYYESKEPNSLGVVLTNWVPTRYVQNSIWDGFAYAAVAFKEGAAVAQVSGLRRFVERHYGATWNETWDEAFQLLYDAAPGMFDREPISSLGLHLRVPWSSDDQLAALIKNRSPHANPFGRVRSLLVQLEPAVVKNQADFKAFALCVEYLDTLFWRDEIVIPPAGSSSLDQDGAKSLIEKIAARDRELAEKLSRDWDQGRFPHSIAKHEPIFGFEPKDQLLWQWQRAAAYSGELASHPNRFYELLRPVVNIEPAHRSG